MAHGSVMGPGFGARPPPPHQPMAPGVAGGFGIPPPPYQGGGGMGMGASVSMPPVMSQPPPHQQQQQQQQQQYYPAHQQQQQYGGMMGGGGGGGGMMGGGSSGAPLTVAQIKAMEQAKKMEKTVKQKVIRGLSSIGGSMTSTTWSNESLLLIASTFRLCSCPVLCQLDVLPPSHPPHAGCREGDAGGGKAVAGPDAQRVAGERPPNIRRGHR